MQIEFSKIAQLTLRNQIEFLEMTWTNKQIVSLLQDVNKVTLDLKNGKFNQFQRYSKDIRSALIGKKHARMYFRKENENKIRILLFFDMRQNPEKIIDLLR